MISTQAAAAAAAAADKKAGKKAAPPVATPVAPAAPAGPTQDATGSTGVAEIKVEQSNVPESAAVEQAAPVEDAVSPIQFAKRFKDAKLAASLAEAWTACESRYTQGVRATLRLQRQTRWKRVEHMATQRRTFLRVLGSERNDSRQTMIQQFQCT